MSDAPPKRGRWVKGQSGNPGGRPSGQVTMAKLIRESTSDGRELVEFVLSVFRGTHNEVTGARARMWSVQWLAERGFGKVVQSIEIEPPKPAPEPSLAGLVAAVLSPDEARLFAELSAKLAAARAAEQAEAEGGERVH